MTMTKTAGAPDAPANVDISRVPATARPFVIGLVDALCAAERRGEAAEKSAAQAEQRASAAEAAARDAKAAEAAAKQALADERRANAERMAAVVAARDALNTVIHSAAAPESVDPAPIGDEPATPIVMDAAADAGGPATPLAVSADVEELCATMVVSGEADNRAAALAILLSEAAARRRGICPKPQAAAIAAMAT